MSFISHDVGSIGCNNYGNFYFCTSEYINYHKIINSYFINQENGIIHIIESERNNLEKDKYYHLIYYQNDEILFGLTYCLIINCLELKVRRKKTSIYFNSIYCIDKKTFNRRFSILKRKKIKNLILECVDLFYNKEIKKYRFHTLMNNSEYKQKTFQNINSIFKTNLKD